MLGVHFHGDAGLNALFCSYLLLSAISGNGISQWSCVNVLAHLSLQCRGRDGFTRSVTTGRNSVSASNPTITHTAPLACVKSWDPQRPRLICAFIDWLSSLISKGNERKLFFHKCIIVVAARTCNCRRSSPEYQNHNRSGQNLVFMAFFI